MESPPTAPPRVLYIDDDPALVRLVEKKNLARHGFVAELALSGTAGVARVAGGGFDVVALDHDMPGQDCRLVAVLLEGKEPVLQERGHLA